MRTLSYACAAALGLAALAGPVLPAAHADDSDFRYGGCNFEYEYPSETQITGMVSDFSVTTTGYGNPRAIGATVTCWLEIDGKGAAPGTTFSYSDLGGVPGVQAGANPVSFTLDNPLAIVFGCESDAFADGTTRLSCQSEDPQMPPQPIADLYDHTWNTVNGVLGVFGMLTPYT
ncbi:MAG: hypothetical protein JO079_05585, partial [Frankiaceae bacterium]|nr:hypothetical protein [Frankiaceae bacterium]MBV9368895.1 hypothetical protein [Frankiales bacterium]